MILKKNGYRTMWISAFDPKYSNKRIFLSNHGVDDFYFDIKNFRLQLGWGISDEDTFNYAFDVLSNQKEPFFAR